MLATWKVATPDGELLAPLGVHQVPSTVMLDADGKIVVAATGPQSLAFFRRRLAELVH